MITWFNSDAKSKNCIATISDSSITLNKYACDFIKNAYTVMLGLDYDKKLVYIKPLNKDQALRGTISQSNQYKITLRSSYGRVSNVDFIREIKSILCLESLIETKKFNAFWNENDETLEIDFTKEVSA